MLYLADMSGYDTKLEVKVKVEVIAKIKVKGKAKKLGFRVGGKV